MYTNVTWPSITARHPIRWKPRWQWQRFANSFTQTNLTNKSKMEWATNLPRLNSINRSNYSRPIKVRNRQRCSIDLSTNFCSFSCANNLRDWQWYWSGDLKIDKRALSCMEKDFYIDMRTLQCTEKDLVLMGQATRQRSISRSEFFYWLEIKSWIHL